MLSLRSSNSQKKGLEAEIKEVELQGKGKWFRVYVGRFGTIGEAEKTAHEYKNTKRIQAFVVVKAPAG